MPSLGIEYSSQDLEKQYMLCEECEQWLGIGEKYLAVLSRGRPNEMARSGLTVNMGGLVHGVDLKLLLRGVLGICFKAHYSIATLYRTFSLDVRFVQRLRHRLLHDDYPPHHYYPTAIKWMAYSHADLAARDICTLALNKGAEGTVAGIEMGGLSINLFLNPTRRKIREGTHLAYGYATQYRPWNWIVGDVLESNSRSEFRELGLEPLPIGTNVHEIDPAGPCPCGLRGNLYGDCCLRLWHASERRVSDLIEVPHLCISDSQCLEPVRELCSPTAGGMRATYNGYVAGSG